MFSDQDIELMQKNLEERVATAHELIEKFLAYEFSNTRASEFARHGFARRMQTVVRCIVKVFDVLPPSQTEPPSKEVRADAEIHVQASLFNTVGALDNLAWILVSELEIKKVGGKDLDKRQVGLGRKHAAVRDALSEDFRKKLEEFDDWFNYLESYRDALAHRIPLYVIPYIIEGDKAEKYDQLTEAMDSASQAKDWGAYEKLKSQRHALVIFRPLLMHSFADSARRMVFHPQLLADLDCINQLAQMTLDEMI